VDELTKYNLNSGEEWEIAFSFIRSKDLLEEFERFRKTQLDRHLDLLIERAKSQHQNSIVEFNEMMAKLLGDKDE
jgi:hypothetical protein